MTDPVSVAALDLDAAGPSGAIWSLPHGGDLDANVIAIQPGGEIATHANPEVDVLIIGLAGRGTVTVDAETLPLRAGSLIHIPKATSRTIAQTGDEPLRYITVHRARPGLGVSRR